MTSLGARLRTLGLTGALLGLSFAPQTGTAALAAPTPAAAVATRAIAPAVNANAAEARVGQKRWVGADLAGGRHHGTALRNDALRIAAATGSEQVADPFGGGRSRTYDRARWTSPWVSTGFPAHNLVPSWNAQARKRTLLRIEIRVADGRSRGSWDEVALWGFDAKGVRAHSGAAQPDDLARLATDTVTANPGQTFDRWRMRVTLLRPTGTSRSPALASVSGVAADRSTVRTPVSRTSMKRDAQIDLPAYSQMVHAGHHPEWGGGGEAWCSPTSIAMVVAGLGRGPKASALTWEKGVDPLIDHAARHTYDHRYRGTGNWPFTTAYAGNYGLDAYVTRLGTLRDVERFVRQGIPVIVSIRFGRGELDGAPIAATDGHLLVISGFTAAGRPLVHDPAAATNAAVRRSYDRAQLERAWLGGSGGIAYIVRRADQPLPRKYR